MFPFKKMKMPKLKCFSFFKKLRGTGARGTRASNPRSLRSAQRLLLRTICRLRIPRARVARSRQPKLFVAIDRATCAKARPTLDPRRCIVPRTSCKGRRQSGGYPIQKLLRRRRSAWQKKNSPVGGGSDDDRFNCALAQLLLQSWC